LATHPVPLLDSEAGFFIPGEEARHDSVDLEETFRHVPISR